MIQAFVSNEELRMIKDNPTITITEDGNYLLTYKNDNLEVLYDPIAEEIKELNLNF